MNENENNNSKKDIFNHDSRQRTIHKSKFQYNATSVIIALINLNIV